MNKYAQSPLQDSGLFGPSPWTILILHLNLDRFGHPAPETNLMRENLMMEIGGTQPRSRGQSFSESRRGIVGHDHTRQPNAYTIASHTLTRVALSSG